MSSFEDYLEETKKSLWGQVCYSTSVKYSPINQKYALIINKVVWYAVRLIVEVDDRCEGGPEILKLTEHLTESGARKAVDSIIEDFEKSKENIQCKHAKAGYYLEIPSNVHQNPDKYLIKGDFLFSNRRVNVINYCHAGIYAGDGMVIHLTVPENCGGESKFGKESCVLKTNWDTFCGTNQSAKVAVFLKLYKVRSHTEVHQIAESLVGTRKGEYNFLNKNCQHFGSYCQSGFDFSPEVFRYTQNFIYNSRKYKL